MEENVLWYIDKRIERTMEGLRKRNMEGHLVNDEVELIKQFEILRKRRKELDNMLPQQMPKDWAKIHLALNQAIAQIAKVPIEYAMILQ